MARAWWIPVGGALLAPLVTWLPMLALRFPDLGLPPYPPPDGVTVWGMHVMWLVLLGVIAFVVGLRDRWLGLAVAVAALTVFYRGAQLDPTSSVMFATGALLVTLLRLTPRAYHGKIAGALAAVGIFEIVYVAHQMMGYDLLWANLWGLPTSAVVQPIGTLGTVDGVGAYIAITAPLMPLWAVPAAIYVVWAGHSLSALLALAVGLLIPWVIRRRGSWLGASVAGLGAVAFLSMAYLKGLATAAVAGRFAIWKFGAAHAVSSDPILGWGLGGWSTHIPQAQLAEKFLPTGEVWREAHNDYLQLGAEMGVVGLLLLGLWLWEHRAMVLDRTWGPSVGALAVNAVGFFPFHTVPLALLGLIVIGLATSEGGGVT
jgi:O-antigen ligase